MPATYLQPVSARRRAVAIGLTIAVHLLILLVLLNLAPERVRRAFGDPLKTFTVAPESGEREKTPEPRQEQKARQAAARPATVRPQPEPVPAPQVEMPSFMRMTREQFAATDLSRVPRKPADAGPAGAGTADSGDSKSAYGPGAGPGGARLYNAEWVREPTDAELRTFLPPTPPGSWGEIACRTIPNNRVENCQVLGESPAGSKLATGMRRAAWQFLVRPPRLGGKAMIGEWVRIRIDITERGVEAKR